MANKAEKLRQEWLNRYDGYDRHRRFGFRRRVINQAARVAADDAQAPILREIGAALGLDLIFKDAPAESEPAPLMAPVWRLQLVRDPNSPRQSRQQITQPFDAYALLAAHLEQLDREHFVILLLDTKNRVIGLNTVAVGTINSALISTRETFKPALLANATAVIVAHNHPSGDPTPSPEDVHVTRSLVEAGRLLEIEVLDHIIIGEGCQTSLKERGLM